MQHNTTPSSSTTIPTQAQTAAFDALAKILIVEDDVTNLEVLRGVLESVGYQLSVASNGCEALETIAQDPPDLILLDVIMPELDGFEVCRRVKASPQWGSVRMISRN